MRTALFVSVAVSLFLANPNYTRAQDEARAIIAKAIKALGGEANLDKVTAWRSKSKGTLTGGTGRFTQEAFVQLPQKFKEVLRLEDREQTVTTIWTGDEGWIEVEGSINRLTGPALAGVKEAMYFTEVNRLTPLKDKKYRVALLDDAVVDGRPAAGVQVAARGHREIQIFFDKETGLPVKTARMIFDPTGQKLLLENRYFSAYEEFAGRRWPRKVVVHRAGKKFMEMEVVEIQALDKINAAVFAKPVRTARPQEPKQPYPYLAEEVRYPNKAAGVEFTGTLTLPRSGGLSRPRC